MSRTRKSSAETFTYEVGEANPSGDGNSYQYVKTPVDKKVPPGHDGPETHLDDANPPSNRVVPPGDGTMWKGDATYMIGSAQRVIQAHQGVVLRPSGWRATSDDGVAFLRSLERSGTVFRGMTGVEFLATVAAAKPVWSKGNHSHSSQGSNFATSAEDAESYVNFGRDDPRVTGRPNYLVQVDRIPEMETSRDGYVKSPIPVDTVRRVWIMEAQDEEIVIRPLGRGKSATTIDQIVSSTDPAVAAKSSDLRVTVKRFSPSTGIWVFKCSGSKGEEYTIRLKGIKKGGMMNLSKAQVQVSCNCNFFRWQGPEHWAKTNGYLFGKPRGTASKPVVKDPPGTHWACKHVLAALAMAREYRFASTTDWSFSGDPMPFPGPNKSAGFSSGMINREDFERTLAQDGREAVSAVVTYKGDPNKVTYKSQDFKRIRFPVQKVVLQYSSGKTLYVGDGKYVEKKQKKVRKQALQTRLARILSDEGLKVAAARLRLAFDADNPVDLLEQLIALLDKEQFSAAKRAAESIRGVVAKSWAERSTVVTWDWKPAAQHVKEWIKKVLGESPTNVWMTKNPGSPISLNFQMDPRSHWSDKWNQGKFNTLRNQLGRKFGMTPSPSSEDSYTLPDGQRVEVRIFIGGTPSANRLASRRPNNLKRLSLPG